MRWTTTAVLAVLLAGLATFYYVYEVRQAPEREKAAAVKDHLWKGVEAKDVEEIVVRKGEATLQLRKTGDAWSLTAPVAAPADRRAAEDLATSLVTVRVEREIDANPQKPADFGLAPPAVEITFKAKGQERGVKLGAKNPTGTWVYAQEAGKPAVLLVPEGLLRDAQKPVGDFRDRTLLAFDRKDVKAVEVRGPAGQVLAAVTAKGPDEWALTAPLAAPADREAITGLLEKLRAAKVKEFVADGKGPAEYGLDRPTRVTLEMGEGATRTTRALRFGKALPDKKGVYAQREGEAGVLVLEEELWQAVPTSAASLRDKSVFAYDRGKLERVEIESPKGKVALALQDGKWRITAPVALRGDEGAVSEWLYKARDLRARDFVAEDAKRLAAYGLDKPQVRLTVWEKDAKEPKTLVLAPAREKDRAYATTLGPGVASVVSVDAKALEDLARGVTELRDHSLAETFDTKDVARITLQRPTVTLTLDRTGAGEEDWQLAEPKKGKVRGSRVSELLWTFRNLKWKTLVAEQGWDPARYGLDAAAVTVTLAGKDDRPLATLAVGKQEGDLRYVRIPGQPALYAIEARTLGELPATPEELLL
ncbi:MAG: DUF4340 domain-containing protein [Candidatus Rokuibacteriota bacterium]